MVARGEIESILLDRHGAVYVEIPKVACTSIKTAIADVVGVSLKESGGNPHDARWPAPPSPPGRTGPPFPGLFAFSFVRDPWDRVVSCYRDKIRGEVDGFTSFTDRPGVANCLARFDAFFAGMSFAEFVRAVASIPDEEADAHFRSQHTFVTDEEGRLAVDLVGRYERLADDWRRICQRIGLPAIELPRLQAVRERRSSSAFYTAETRRIIADRYCRDAQMFGYAVDPG